MSNNNKTHDGVPEREWQGLRDSGFMVVRRRFRCRLSSMVVVNGVRWVVVGVSCPSPAFNRQAQLVIDRESDSCWDLLLRRMTPTEEAVHDVHEQ